MKSPDATDLDKQLNKFRNGSQNDVNITVTRKTVGITNVGKDRN